MGGRIARVPLPPPAEGGAADVGTGLVAGILLAASLGYARRGWRVFPVSGKRPLTEHGFKDASKDEAILRGWWTRWPEAGIGVPTGAVSGLVVLDVDPRHGGDASLARLTEKRGPLPTGPVVLTGGGGRHYYFAHPGGTVPIAHGFMPGLDLQGDGAYVVTPPSGHPSGGTYRWADGSENLQLPLVPPWLLSDSGSESRSGIRVPVGSGSTLPHGRHHDWIVAQAASVAAKTPGLGEGQLRLWLEGACRAAMDDADSHLSEIAEAARSAVLKFGLPAAAAEVSRDDGPTLHREIVASLTRVYSFVEAWHAPVLGLHVLQAALARVLPRVWHVYLSGPPGSGKTGLGRRLVDLESGRMLGDASVAALARTTEFGRAIGIDESDVERGGEDARAARDALVRDAYRSDAPSYQRVDGKTGKVHEYPVYGPRVLISREDLDTATATRGIPIGCVAPWDEETYSILLEGLWPTGVVELAARVSAWGAARIAAVSPRELEHIAAEPGFRSRVREIAGTTAASREAELAVVMLLAVGLAGLDHDALRPQLQSALAAGRVASPAVDDQLTGDAVAALRELLGRPTLLPPSDITRIRRKEWLDATTKARRARGELPISSRAWGRVLRDLGVRDSWRTNTGGVAAYDLPQEVVAAVLGGGGTLRTGRAPAPAQEPNSHNLRNLSNSPNHDSQPAVHERDSGASGVSGDENDAETVASVPSRPIREGVPEEFITDDPTKADRARARLGREDSE